MLMRLSNHALFQGWNRLELKSLLSKSSLKDYKVGETIFKRGHSSTDFYFISDGQVQLQLCSPSGIIKKIKVLSKDDVVGETSMLMGTAYRVDAVALSASHLIKVPQQVYFEHLAQHPKLMRLLIANLSERLYCLLGDVLSSTLYSGTQRAISYLLGDCSFRNGVRITLSRPKAQIAGALNLTPEHFSRILNDLSSKGFIAVEGRHIEFLDIEGLFAYER